jgi:hypothetical protein
MSLRVEIIKKKTERCPLLDGVRGCHLTQDGMSKRDEGRTMLPPEGADDSTSVWEYEARKAGGGVRS